jgi:hypothetical protein
MFAYDLLIPLMLTMTDAIVQRESHTTVPTLDYLTNLTRSSLIALSRDAPVLPKRKADELRAAQNVNVIPC